MSIENVTYAFQNAATTGAGVNQFCVVSGTFRARISQTVTGGTVTVLAIRPEEQKGWSRRPS